MHCSSYLGGEGEEALAAFLQGEVAVAGAHHVLLGVEVGAVDPVPQEAAEVAAGLWLQGVGVVAVGHVVCRLEVGAAVKEVLCSLSHNCIFESCLGPVCRLCQRRCCLQHRHRQILKSCQPMSDKCLLGTSH